MRATLALGAVALTLAPSALADAVYHSAHIALTPVGASPLRSGFVENVHPNGPNVFAHEQYVLNGAVPNMTYTVTIHITSLADTTCATPFLNLDTASLTWKTVNDLAVHVLVRVDGKARSIVRVTGPAGLKPEHGLSLDGERQS